MALETTASVTTVSNLVVANPAVTDSVQQGDDHLRIIKYALTATFPDLTTTISCASAELLYAHEGGTVSGNSMVKGTLTQSGCATFKSTVLIEDAVTISGAATLLGTLTVSDSATFKDQVSISGTLNVGGELRALSTLTVAGNCIVKGSLSASANTIVYTGARDVSATSLYNSDTDLTIAYGASGTYVITGNTGFKMYGAVTPINGSSPVVARIDSFGSDTTTIKITEQSGTAVDCAFSYVLFSSDEATGP